MAKRQGKMGKEKEKKLQRAIKEKTGSSTDRAGLSKVLNSHVESVLPIMSDEILHVSEKTKIVFVKGQSPNS